MLQHNAVCMNCGSAYSGSASGFCEVCSDDLAVNDNIRPPGDAVTIANLAAAIGADEDTVIQRIAAILSRRGNPSADEAEGLAP